MSTKKSSYQSLPFLTELVQLRHSHVIEPDDPKKFKNGCGEFSIYALMNDAQARKWLEILHGLIEDELPPPIQSTAKKNIRFVLDEESNLVRFRFKQNPRFGRPVVFRKENYGSKTPLNHEIPDGSFGYIQGILSPYDGFGGGVKAVLKVIIVESFTAGQSNRSMTLDELLQRRRCGTPVQHVAPVSKRFSFPPAGNANNPPNEPKSPTALTNNKWPTISEAQEARLFNAFDKIRMFSHFEFERLKKTIATKGSPESACLARAALSVA